MEKKLTSNDVAEVLSNFFKEGGDGKGLPPFSPIELAKRLGIKIDFTLEPHDHPKNRKSGFLAKMVKKGSFNSSEKPEVRISFYKEAYGSNIIRVNKNCATAFLLYFFFTKKLFEDSSQYQQEFRCYTSDLLINTEADCFSSKREKKAALKFARELMMPSYLVRKLLDKCTLVEMARIFDVKESFVLLRLEELGILGNTEQDILNSLKKDKVQAYDYLKQQRKQKKRKIFDGNY